MAGHAVPAAVKRLARLLLLTLRRRFDQALDRVPGGRKKSQEPGRRDQQPATECTTLGSQNARAAKIAGRRRTNGQNNPVISTQHLTRRHQRPRPLHRLTNEVRLMRSVHPKSSLTVLAALEGVASVRSSNAAGRDAGGTRSALPPLPARPPAGSPGPSLQIRADDVLDDALHTLLDDPIARVEGQIEGVALAVLIAET